MKKLFFALTVTCTIFAGHAWAMEDKNGEKLKHSLELVEKVKKFVNLERKKDPIREKRKRGEPLNQDELVILGQEVNFKDADEVTKAVSFLTEYMEIRSKKIDQTDNSEEKEKIVEEIGNLSKAIRTLSNEFFAKIAQKNYEHRRDIRDNNIR